MSAVGLLLFQAESAANGLANLTMLANSTISTTRKIDKNWSLLVTVIGLTPIFETAGNQTGTSRIDDLLICDAFKGFTKITQIAFYDDTGGDFFLQLLRSHWFASQ